MQRNYAYIHKEGCELPAFYLECIPPAGALISSADVELPNGSRPNAWDDIVCGSCGERLVASFKLGLSRANIEALS